MRPGGQELGAGVSAQPSAHWCMTYRVPEGSQPFAMLKWLDPEVEAAWDWSSTAYLGLAFD